MQALFDFFADASGPKPSRLKLKDDDLSLQPNMLV